jgi:hypothetical protein
MDSFAWLVRTKHRKHMRAIVNVDKAPSSSVATVGSVLSAIEQHIPIKRIHVPNFPSFAAAVKRVWSMSDAPYVLHLEDDWEFTREIDLDECIQMMREKRADYVRFSKRQRPMWEEKDKVSLLPSLWFGSTVRKLAQHMSTTIDPEKQLRPGVLENPVVDATLPKKIYDYRQSRCVRDIGREWRDEKGICKWQKADEGAITWAE